MICLDQKYILVIFKKIPMKIMVYWAKAHSSGFRITLGFLENTTLKKQQNVSHIKIDKIKIKINK